jgi:hypothetical protein
MDMMQSEQNLDQKHNSFKTIKIIVFLMFIFFVCAGIGAVFFALTSGDRHKLKLEPQLSLPSSIGINGQPLSTINPNTK